MSLDELTLDGNEAGGTSTEAPSEKSEKQKESSRRAQAQLQKTQKDEKKAKSDNDDLFLLLARFIQNPLYEELIPTIVLLLQHAFPSRFILVSISLVYGEAAHYLFEKLSRPGAASAMPHIYRYPTLHTFHNDDIHATLRDWVTLWMSGSQEYLTKEGTSVILTQKLLRLLAGSEKEYALKAISEIFTFFFAEKNVSIEKGKSRAYAEFILSQMQNSLKLYLDTEDSDLRTDANLDTNTLFGI